MESLNGSGSVLLSVLLPLSTTDPQALADLNAAYAAAFPTVAHELLLAPLRAAERADAPAPGVRILPAPAVSTQPLAVTLAQGLRAARGEYICVLADVTPQGAELAARLYAEAAGADIVVASRHISGGEPGRPARPDHWAQAEAQRQLAPLFLRRARVVTDPLSGSFLVRRSVFAGSDLRPEGSSLLPDLLALETWTRLVEVPYTEAPSPATAPRHPRTTLWHLRALRTPRGASADVEYRRVPAILGPDDPEPLDDDLPLASTTRHSARRRPLLLLLIGLAVLARLVLLPLGHFWDLTIDYNVFVDLMHNHSPYDTMRTLSNIARSAGWDSFYEYYAYPPVPLYIYYPLAKIFGLLHPNATYFIARQGAAALPNLPLDFYLLLKLPIWIADFIIAGVLLRMTGRVRSMWMYLLNPFVLIVSGAWTFDAIMVAAMLLGVYWTQRGKMGRAGLALAFGTMVKFIPVVAVPMCALYLIQRKRPVREVVLFVVAYAAGCIVLLGPFVQGVLYVVSFHGTRLGGGMNWENIFALPANWWPYNVNPLAIGYTIGAFTTPLLIIMLLLAVWRVANARMTLNQMVLLALLAFFIGSKLVNEQYALSAIPFLIVEAHRTGGAWKWFQRLFWIVPLLFTVFRVPIDRFLWLTYHTFLGDRANIIAATKITGFESPFVPWKHDKIDPLAIIVLGIAFFVLCVVAFCWPIKPGGRPPGPTAQGGPGEIEEAALVPTTETTQPAVQ